MEEQGSICLQKITIIILSMILFSIIITISTLEKDFLITKAENMSIDKVFNNDVKVASSNVKITDKLNEQNEKSLITVNQVDNEKNFTITNQTKNEENDIILTERIAYAAATSIDAHTNIQSGDVTEKIEQSNTLIEKLSINKNESTLDIANDKDNKPKAEETKAERKNQTQTFKSYKTLAESNPPEEYKSVYEVSATAYCLCQKCCGKSPSSPNYGMTASGMKIVPGTGAKAIAVDTSVIPLGSKVYVEGLNGAWDYGYAVAADTGSAIKNNKIDLYMDKHSECLSWGRKNVKVYVIE